VERDRREEELALLVFGENDLGEAVRVARTVDDAFDVLFGDGLFTPHLILLGVTAGGGAELELAKRLREDWRTKTIPIILVASREEDCERFERAGLGLSSFLIRPVEFEKLVEAASAFSLWWRALARSTS
jgi:two-component system, response regulator